MKPTWVLRFMSLWPPLLGAGIRVKKIAPNFRYARVEMNLRFWNSNYVGSHYGGSLYSMTDPFYMLMLIHILGKEFTVWDKSASIRFRKPGKGLVFAEFRIEDADINWILNELQSKEKTDFSKSVYIYNASNEIVAEIQKVMQVRKK